MNLQKTEDIRIKKWITLNKLAAKTLKSIICAEDYLIRFDDYQMEKGQIYPEIEDMMLILGSLRKQYSDFIDRHPELLEITENEI